MASDMRETLRFWGKLLRKRRKRGPVSGAVKGWVTATVGSAAVTVATWVLVFMLVAGGLLFVINLLATPLEWLSSPFRAIAGTSSEDDEEELDEARAEFDEQAEDDPVLACLLHIPEVTAVNDPLYVGEVPEDITTTVAGPNGRPTVTSEPAENSELVSDGDPVVQPGSQVVDAQGRSSEDAEAALETVPEDTPAVIARAYLVSALAGGTTGFDHFETVAARALDGQKVNADNAAQVAQAFFPVGTDLRPYYRVADAYVYRGMEEGAIRNEAGEGDFVYERLADCDEAATDTTS